MSETDAHEDAAEQELDAPKAEELEKPQSKRPRNDRAIALLFMLGIALVLFGLLIFGKLGPREAQTETVEKPNASQTEVVEAAQTPTPEPEAEPVIADNILPTFDLVRVDAARQALIAGRTAPNSDVVLKINDQEHTRMRVGANGNFVFQTELPESDGPLQAALYNGKGESSGAVVLLQPQSEGEPERVVLVEEDGTTNVTEVKPEIDATPPEITALTLDTINYTQTGDVKLGGRLTDGKSVRVYVDNEPASLTKAEGGQWSVEIADIQEGLYTLRVDALAEDGSVEERVESPFQRVYPEELGPNVTIQPGYTLWKLAEIKYGSGDRYLQIVIANKDIIKDPDLIYPVQLFELPE